MVFNSITILNRIILVKSKFNHRKFIHSTKNIEHSQYKILMRILKSNSKTQFGLKYKFNTTNSYSDFKINTPILKYSDYSDWIDKIVEGEDNVLTRTKVKILEPTSGTSSEFKLIPYNSDLQNDFQKAIDPWLYDIMSNYSGVSEGRSFWLNTPKTKINYKNSKINIGFEDDSEYLSHFLKYIHSKIFAVPNFVREIDDNYSYIYILLLFLIQSKNISFISVWNPTFIEVLFSNLDKNILDISNDLEKSRINSKLNINSNLRKKINSYLRTYKQHNYYRSKEIRNIINSTRCYEHKNYECLFPNLVLISCWTHGFAKQSINCIKKYFPNISIQGKGLIATEGIVSIPLNSLEYPVLAVNSHFFEFFELNDDYSKKTNIKLAHELKKGKLYIPIITTSGGLYRYDLGDILECRGFYNNAPCFEFMGKYDNVVDVTGEKLSELFVSDVIGEVFGKLKKYYDFVLVGPEKKNDLFNYAVLIEINDESKKDLLLKKVDDLEKSLCGNYHYLNSRNMGQLSKIRMRFLPSGSQEKYILNIKSKQTNMGSIKTQILVRDINIYEKFKLEKT